MSTMIGRWTVGALLLVMGVAIACGQTIVEQTFDGDEDLTERGWRVEADETQSEWKIVDGHLEVTCLRNPYKGGRIVRDVPIIERGTLEFDCRLGVEGSRNYGHLSLGLKLFGHLMAFKKYSGHHLLVHVPAENIMYSVTDAVPLDEWVHFRVEFDMTRGRVEYYLGDATDPLKIDMRLTMNTEGETGELELFNYGLTKGTVVNWVDNVVLRSLDDGQATTSQRTGALVFRGISSERYRAEQAVGEVLAEEQISVYTMGTRSSATTPTNKLALDRVPGAATWRQARYIVLADVPAGPAECLPPHLLADLDQAVREGANLLVLGGAFAFGKGAYSGTPLAEMLPVETGGVWDLKRFDAPQAIADGAALLWYHEVGLKPGEVEVTITAGGKPVAVTWAYGQGRVTAFLGTALGSESDFAATGATPFWEWDGWPDLVREMLGVGEGR